MSRSAQLAVTRVLSPGTPGVKRPAAGGDATEPLPAAVKPQMATKDQQQKQQGKKQKKGPAADASIIATGQGGAVGRDSAVAEGGGPNGAPLAEKLQGSQENSGSAGAGAKKAAAVGKKAKAAAAAAAAAAQGGDENGQGGEAPGVEPQEKGRLGEEGTGVTKGLTAKAKAKAPSRPAKRAKKEEKNKGAGETEGDGGSGGEEADGEGEGKEGGGGGRRGGAVRSQRAAARGKRYAGQDEDGSESDVQVGWTKGCTRWGGVRQFLSFSNPMSRCLRDEWATRPAAEMQMYVCPEHLGVRHLQGRGSFWVAHYKCYMLSATNAICRIVRKNLQEDEFEDVVEDEVLAEREAWERTAGQGAAAGGLRR